MTQTPYEQGVAHYQAGDYEAGLTSFTEAINQNYQPLEAAYDERSKCYEALSKLDEAKADLAHMLTLSIDEARRKQTTDLIALLDQAEIKPLSPPDKIPPGIKVREDRDTLTLGQSAWVNPLKPRGIKVREDRDTLTLSVGSKITLTLGADSLRVVQTPGFFSGKFTHLEIPYAEIAQITCQRELTNSNTVREIKATYSLQRMSLNNSPITLLKLTNYDQIRYIQWKLREQLNLPDTPQPNEYIHGKKAVGIRKRPIRQLNRYDVRFFSLVIIAIASPSFCMIFVGITSFLDPISQQREPFLSLERLPGLLLMALNIASPLVLLTMTDILPMRRVQQLLDNGRTTHGIVTAKICKNYGKGQFYHVYYRYYGYEAVFNSKHDFDRWNVGDIIYVKYLPDKPHIST